MSTFYWVCGSNSWTGATNDWYSGTGSSTIYKWSLAAPVFVTGTWTNTSTTFTTSSSVTLTAGTQIVSDSGYFVGKVSTTATGTTFTLNNIPATNSSIYGTICFAADSDYLIGRNPNYGDDVLFDSGAVYTVWLSTASQAGNAQCGNLTVSTNASYAGNVLFTSSSLQGVSWFIYGSVYLNPDTTTIKLNPTGSAIRFQHYQDSTIFLGNTTLQCQYVFFAGHANGGRYDLTSNLYTTGEIIFASSSQPFKFYTNDYQIYCYKFSLYGLVTSSIAASCVLDLGASTLTAFSLDFSLQDNSDQTYPSSWFKCGTSTIRCIGLSTQLGLKIGPQNFNFYIFERYPYITQKIDSSTTLTWSSGAPLIPPPLDLSNNPSITLDCSNSLGFTAISSSTNATLLASATATFNTIRLYACNLPLPTDNTLVDKSYLCIYNMFNSVNITNSPYNINITVANIVAVGTLPSRRIILNGVYDLRFSPPLPGMVEAVSPPVTITIGSSYSLDNCDFREIKIAGSLAPISPSLAGNWYGNDGIIFPPSKTVYYNDGGVTSRGRSAHENVWSTTRYETPQADSYPLAQDNVVLPSDFGLLYISNGFIVTDLTVIFSTTNDMYLRAGTGVVVMNILGNFTISNGSTLTLVNISHLRIGNKSGREQIISFPRDEWLPLNKLYTGGSSTYIWGTGKVTLNTDVNYFDYLSLYSGTLNLNGKTLYTNINLLLSNEYGTPYGKGYPKNIDFGDGGTLDIKSSLTNQSSYLANNQSCTTFAGSGKINFSGTTYSHYFNQFEGGRSGISSGLSCKNITLQVGDAGGLLYVIGNNTFKQINSARPASIAFTGGATTVADIWNLKGKYGATISLTSNNTLQATLSKPSTGVVSLDYINLTQITATGGSGWYATNSTNPYNKTTGVTFTAAPASATNNGSFIPILMDNNP